MRNLALSSEDNPKELDFRVEPSPQITGTVHAVGTPLQVNRMRTRLNALLVGLGAIHHAMNVRGVKEHLVRNVQGAKTLGAEDGINASNLSLVPLRQASLCLDCETITTASTKCQACGSQALLNVARALNRQRSSDLASSGRPAVVGYPRRASANRLSLTGAARVRTDVRTAVR